MQIPANLEGLTWCEKLEVLRSVNKRQEKRQHKIPKLRFVKDTPLQVHATPISKPKTASDQLYQQRRIKHLLMQARMKGIDHFDWLKESPRYRNSNSNSDNDSTSGDSDFGDHSGPHGKVDKPFGAGMEVSEAEKVLLSRYNMMSSIPKETGWKMMPEVPAALQRSNTTVFQS